MSDERLRSLLREAPIPVEPGAERRGLAVVEAAFAERQPRRRPSLPRLALAFAAATLFAALLLSPAGAAVRDLVDEALTTEAPNPSPGLTEIPGGGELLVQSAAGPWVVRQDGSRRLLGDYEEATWSPRGLFVAAAEGTTLSALEPDGSPRWSIAAGAAVGEQRWSPSGFRIAYRSGDALRVIAGDGTGDALLAPATAPVAPAWSPVGATQLAYVDAGGELRIADSESGEQLAAASALPGAFALDWAGAASVLLEASPAELRLRTVSPRKIALRLAIGAPRSLPLPAGATLGDAALSPDGSAAAALLRGSRAGVERSTVLLFDTRGGGARRLLAVPGRLDAIEFSPRSDRLLVGWPEADAWLFLPTGRGEGRSIGDVAAAFAPGEPSAAAFPRVAGWCCAR